MTLSTRQADNRLFTFSELTRRDLLAFISSVAFADTMGLLGCSSSPTGPGDGGGGDTGVKPPGSIGVNGTVSLPPGSTLVLDTLKLNVLGQSYSLATGTPFDAGVTPSAPTMAMVTNANGDGIMAGFLDPTILSAQPITARSTGVVLMWFSIGGPFLPGNLKSQILAQLTADTSMDALGTVIAQRIAADPLAIVNGDSQVAAALGAALTVLSSGSARSITHVVAASMDDPPHIAVTPINDQSGISVRSAPSVVGVTVSNSARRPAKVYVYETQSVTNGVTTDVSPAKLVAGPFDIGLPTSLNAVTELKAFLADPAPFKTYTIDPIPLALDGAAEQTTYEVVVIGPSSRGTVPDFFNAPRYASQVLSWNVAIKAMYARTFFTDLCYALFLEMTGFGSVNQSSPNLFTAASTMAKITPPTDTPTASGLPGSKTKLYADYNAKVNEILSDPALANEMLLVTPNTMDTIAGQAAEKYNKGNWPAKLNKAAGFIQKLSGPLLGIDGGRAGKVFNDLDRSDQGALWTAVLSKSKVSIAPDEPAVVVGDEVSLTVLLSADLTSTYEYDWSSGSLTATFSATDQADSGTTLNTQQATVKLKASATDTVPIGVQVLVFDVALGHKALVGKATATVAILPKATLTPVAPVLLIDQKQTFTVTVDGPLPSGVKYIWTLEGSAGTIGTLNLVTTNVPTLQYTAIRKGTDQLSVQIADANNKLVAKASAEITVAPDEFIDVTITGNWIHGQQPDPGHYLLKGDGGGRGASPFGNGLDGVFLSYGDAPDGTIGILVGLFEPIGEPIRQGESWSKVAVGQSPIGGQYSIVMATDLNDPSAPNSLQLVPPGVGSLTIDSLTQLGDGTHVAQYSFFINNGAGGTMTGNGAGKWA